jgi:hypothetical protein
LQEAARALGDAHHDPHSISNRHPRVGDRIPSIRAFPHPGVAVVKPQQEPKYRAVAPHYPENDGLQTQLADGFLINRKSGEQIPDDEPVMIFRARDLFARDAIAAYLGQITALGCDPTHIALVKARFEDFQAFAIDHPERMKRPD